MKYLVVILSVVFIQSALATGINWSELQAQSSYKLGKNIVLELDEKKFHLKSGTKLFLKTISDMRMIKVKLFKFQLDNCPSNKLETDLVLIPIQQESGEVKSVGVNISGGCSLDIYVEMEDYNSNSFLYY